MCHRFLIIVLFSLLLSASSYAQDNKGLTAEKCFKEAPGTVLGLIAPNTRLDMIDYYRAGIDRQSANTAGGQCKIIDFQDYSISFTGGNGIEYQMFVINPTSSNPLIGLIQTIDTPIPDSALTLYSTDWNIIPASSNNALGSEPIYESWILPYHLKEISSLSRSVPFVLAKLTYDPVSGTITATNNMNRYFTASDIPEAMSMLKDSIIYKWQPKAQAFLPVK